MIVYNLYNSNNLYSIDIFSMHCTESFGLDYFYIVIFFKLLVLDFDLGGEIYDMFYNEIICNYNTMNDFHYTQYF